VALLEVDPALWLLACGAGSTAGSWLWAATTVGARIKAHIAAICFIYVHSRKIGVPSGTY